MLRAFGAVLIDLWYFATGREHVHMAPKLKLPNPTPLLLPAAGVTEPTCTVDDIRTAIGRSIFIKVQTTPLLVRPVVSFDGRLGELTFGNKTTLLATEGKFVKVAYRGQKGWVSLSAVTLDSSSVTAKLLSNEMYGFDHNETQKLRKHINDECMAAQLRLPLQAEEYIMYRLLIAGVKVAWPLTRPRKAGVWQTLLRGKAGIIESIEPRNNSVMEFFHSSQAVLAFVSSVSPEQTIKITGVGWQSEGVYFSKILSKVEWVEYRPVFISFS